MRKIEGQLTSISQDVQHYVKELQERLTQHPAFDAPNLRGAKSAMLVTILKTADAAFEAAMPELEAGVTYRDAQAAIDRVAATIEALKAGVEKSIQRLGEIAEDATGETNQSELCATFPYQTKALAAAAAAATKFWSDYDPARPPLQKQVASFIAEQGVPVRQAQELATAIKPDNLPQ